MSNLSESAAQAAVQDSTTESSVTPAAAGSEPGAAPGELAQAYHLNASATIVVDSCADFNPDVVRQLGVDVIRFTYVTSTGEHYDDFWQSVSAHEFYDLMRDGERVTTSAVTPGRYKEEFERACAKGKPVVYLGLTQGLSSSIEAARTGAAMLCEEHPEYEIHVVDNRCPSASAELLALEAVRLAGHGYSAAEIAEWAGEACYFLQGYFTLDSLNWLAQGGRIPPAAAQVGGKLDLKPELSYDTTGALTLRGVCRGRKKALRALINEFRENFDGETRQPIGIVSSDAEKDAKWLEDAIRKEPGCADTPVIHSQVSPVIGAHVGPGMVALVFWGKDRRERSSISSRIARKIKGNR